MLRAKDMPVLFGAMPGGVSRPAPLLGQNGREILAEYGCDAYVIAALIAGGGVTEERAA